MKVVEAERAVPSVPDVAVRAATASGTPGERVPLANWCAANRRRPFA
jgi:hypothetical protein